MEKPRILVVDDDTLITRVLARTLRGAGANADTASGVYEALGMVLDQHYDAVVTDVTMKDGDGFKLAHAVRGILKEDAPPFLFMSAYCYDDAPTKAAALGAQLIDKIEMQKIAAEAIKLAEDDPVKVCW